MESPLKILKRYRIRPVKRLGQSFLVDNNITSRIVDASKIGRDDTVVEIGAGLGTMTSMIAERAKKVVALEIDPKLVNVLNGRTEGNIQHRDNSYRCSPLRFFLTSGWQWKNKGYRQHPIQHIIADTLPPD